MTKTSVGLVKDSSSDNKLVLFTRWLTWIVLAAVMHLMMDAQALLVLRLNSASGPSLVVEFLGTSLIKRAPLMR